MSLAMDLAALWICGGENGTNGCHLGVFSVNVAFARHSMATHPPPTLPGIGYAST